MTGSPNGVDVLLAAIAVAAVALAFWYDQWVVWNDQRKADRIAHRLDRTPSFDIFPPD